MQWMRGIKANYNDGKKRKNDENEGFYNSCY